MFTFESCGVLLKLHMDDMVSLFNITVVLQIVK